MSADDKKKMDKHYQRFKKHVQPILNPIFNRYKFNLAVQSADTVEQYITRLKMLVRDCRYHDPDEMVRDRIVFGIQEEKAWEKLINVGVEFTLAKATDIVQTYEYSQIQLKAVKGEVDAIDTSVGRGRGRAFNR